MKQPDRLVSDDARYRLLIEAITDYAIYMLDTAGIVSSWNPGAQRFKGYEPSEIIGQHFSRFYTEEDKKAGVPARALETSACEGRQQAAMQDDDLFAYYPSNNEHRFDQHR